MKYGRGNGGRSNLDAVNQILIVVVAGLLGYVAIKLSLPPQGVADPVSERVEMDQDIAGFDIASKDVGSFRVYEESIKAKNLFEPLANDLQPDPKVLQKALPALHQRIKLIGILMDADSKAIVEDLKENQTHFLSKGESLGGVYLEDIREDKVIFKYDNERVEMAP
jgi:hypothetical protein